MDIHQLLRKATSGGTTCVYAYLRTSDHSPYYVGVSTLHGRALCQTGHRKHGISVPKDRSLIVVLRGNLTKAQAGYWEAFFIRRYGRIDLGTGILRNRSDGGEGLQNPSPATRAKISAFMRVRPPSSRQIEHIRKVGKRPKSEETKRLMSEAQKGRSMHPSQLANFKAAIAARIARNAAANGLSVEAYKEQVAAKVTAGKLRHKRQVQEAANALGMSRRSYRQWLADGQPSDHAPYRKTGAPPIPGHEDLTNQAKRKAERNLVGLSERQYRLWVADGRPANVAHYRTIYGKPGRRPKAELQLTAA